MSASSASRHLIIGPARCGKPTASFADHELGSAADDPHHRDRNAAGGRGLAPSVEHDPRSLAGPIEWARRVRAAAPDAPATAECVAAILLTQGHSLSMHELIRVVWVLRFDPDALTEPAPDGFVPVRATHGTSNR